MRLIILALAVALLAFCWRTNMIGSAETWLRLQGGGAQATSDLEKSLSRRLVTVQQMKRVGELQVDGELQEWVGKHIDVEVPDMDRLLQSAQQAFPGYQQMTAMHKWAATEDELFRSLEGWSEIGGKDYTHLAVTVRPSQGNWGLHGCVVLGQRLPTFTPEALNADPGVLYSSHCALCGKLQACQLAKQGYILGLQCTRCWRIYAMVAPGMDGRYRFVNEFLEGYKPPVKHLIDQSRRAELMTIWQTVTAGCRYTTDIGSIQGSNAAAPAREIWQTARETERLGRGDCEDSAILLTEWLLARGFEARVAAGFVTGPGGGGHAWVVVRLDGTEYLLEPTEGANGAQRLLTISEAGPRYAPLVLFDRHFFYIRPQPTRWDGSYWSESTWKRMDLRADPTQQQQQQQ
jgi:predicted transglutaminase-like cysteine proteinase